MRKREVRKECGYMSSFLCFCFHKNLRELNGVRTEMNGEKDEFLFLRVRERRVWLAAKE